MEHKNGDLPSNLRQILLSKLKGYSQLICESMIHIDACLKIEHNRFPKLNTEENSVLHVIHYKLAIIEASKLLNYKISDGKYSKNENDKYSVFAILSFIDGLKPQYKSKYLSNTLENLKIELSSWKEFHSNVLDLRNEWFAHLGTEKRRNSINYVNTGHLNNLIVLLNEFQTILNSEYDLGLSNLFELDLEIIDKIYEKGFS